METLIVQPSSQSKLEALKAFLTALKIDFKTAEKEERGVISNPETIRRIEDYEKRANTNESSTLGRT